MCTGGFSQKIDWSPHPTLEYSSMSMNHVPEKRTGSVSLCLTYSFCSVICSVHVWCGGTVQRRLALEMEVKRNERLQSEHSSTVATQVYWK